MDFAAQAQVLDVLRMQRRRELESLIRDRWLSAQRPDASAEEPAASAARIHDAAHAVLARIDAAEQAMRPVLQAWERDPARRGAHLLQGGVDEAGPDSFPAEVLGDPTVPAQAGSNELPDTVPAAAPRSGADPSSSA